MNGAVDEVDAVAAQADGAVGTHVRGAVPIEAGRTEPPPASPAAVIRPLRFGVGGVLPDTTGFAVEECFRLYNA
ncbi:hypothetical protein SDC9_142611 [bioreactor metagenome]|uniref:Uncharacterized protein n=1 Tax=bioreactor metagenome TaxID=1076179 RepID=A0A645E1A8_9ZZZZ